MEGNVAAYIVRGYCGWVQIRPTSKGEADHPGTKLHPPPDEAFVSLFVLSTIQKII